MVSVPSLFRGLQPLRTCRKPRQGRRDRRAEVRLALFGVPGARIAGNRRSGSGRPSRVSGKDDETLAFLDHIGVSCTILMGIKVRLRVFRSLGTPILRPLAHDGTVPPGARPCPGREPLDDWPSAPAHPCTPETASVGVRWLAHGAIGPLAVSHPGVAYRPRRQRVRSSFGESVRCGQ